jgi:hypothetical protein
MNSYQRQRFMHKFSVIYLSNIDSFSNFFSLLSYISFLKVFDFQIFYDSLIASGIENNSSFNKFLFLYIIHHCSVENLLNSIFLFLNNFFLLLSFRSSGLEKTKSFVNKLQILSRNSPNEEELYFMIFLIFLIHQ